MTGCTKKVAKAIASSIKGKLVEVSKAKKEDVLKADVIGFGSGIYALGPHRSLIKFIDSLPVVEGKKAFLFFTSGCGCKFFTGKLKRKLKKKGFELLGDFVCKGYDRYGPLKLIGGINKGRPNKKDLDKAKEFARKNIYVRQ